MHTLSLFEQDPKEPFEAAFEDWLHDQHTTGRLRRRSSVDVYRSMWGSFSRWCVRQTPALTLGSIRPEDLAAFQAARFGLKSSEATLSPRHALRLMRLIDRVVRHHAAQSGEPANSAASDWIAAQPEVRYADAAHADPLPMALSGAEARRLIQCLSGPALRVRFERSRKQRAEPASTTWQDVRNRAAVGLQLGAGLAPGEVRSLLVSSPVSQGGPVPGRPWKVAVAGNGNSPAREAPIAPWAGEILRNWLVVRAQSGIGGEFLFPSTRAGKPWSKEAQYKAARQVMADAALDVGEGGSFRLRHTFALRQLRRGTAPAQVACWLGVEPEEIYKYLRIVAAPQPVV